MSRDKFDEWNEQDKRARLREEVSKKETYAEKQLLIYKEALERIVRCATDRLTPAHSKAIAQSALSEADCLDPEYASRQFYANEGRYYGG